MNENLRELVEAWLDKAHNDIVSADQILLLPDGPTDTVCFHAQQAVEKSLKGVLTFHEVSFPKTHSLVRLLDLALRFMPEIERFRERFAEMSAHGVEFRYPLGLPDPSREEAKAALAVAKKVLTDVRSHTGRLDAA